MKVRHQKSAFATRLPRELKDRLNQVVYNVSGPMHRTTVAVLVERALSAERNRLEAEHSPWQFDGQPKAGRPGKL